ncbi:MAG: FUSC family protein, partial [Burkholderiaceae bacterium]
NEQSLAIEDRLTRYAREAPHAAGHAGSAEDDLRGRVLRCEIAAETLATVARTASSAENQDAPARHRLAALLRALREAVRGGAPFDAAAGSKAVTVDGTATPLDADLRWRFRRAAETLTERAAWEVPLPALREESVPPPSPEEPRPMFDDHTRRALQACAAALAAMLAGHAISDQRWYWAVIAAFVVFTRAMTLGQALSQAWQRVLATVVGVGIGLLIAELVHSNRDLELALLFVFVAVGFYLFRAYQPAYVMLLTAMLAMLYELIGRYSPGVLYVRLAETLAGAAAAAISAAVILPVRTSEIADRNSAALLREASGLLRTAFDRADRPAPPDAVRDLDRKLQALRRELEPVTETSYPAPKAAGRRRLHRLSILVYCIRHLYNLRAGQPTDPDRLRALRGMAHTVAENMEALAAVLEADDGKRHRNVAAPKTLSRPDPVMHGDPQQGAAAGDQWHITAGWLWESNDVLRAMYGDATA